MESSKRRKAERWKDKKKHIYFLNMCSIQILVWEAFADFIDAEVPDHHAHRMLVTLCPFMHILYFVVQELLECSFIWQLQHIGGDKQVIVHAGNRVFHHLLTLAGAK